jgi:hypothetical protein
MDFYEKAHFVKPTWRPSTWPSAMAALCPSRYATMRTFDEPTLRWLGAYNEIRLFELKALQSSDRSLLLLEEDQVRIAQSPLEIRSAFGQQRPWPSSLLLCHFRAFGAVPG